MEINPLFLDDCASLIFWNNIVNLTHTVNQLDGEIVKSNGNYLINLPNADKILINFLSENQLNLTKEQFNDLKRQIAIYSFNKCKVPLAMLGSIFLEDLEFGKSPSAMNVNLNNTVIPPKNITYSQPIEELGVLLLRTPLPSVVISDRRPKSNFIKINSNSLALNQSYPLFLTIQNCQEVKDFGLCILSGVFSIPVKDDNHSNQWKKVIPNALYVKETMNIYFNTSPIKINFNW